MVSWVMTPRSDVVLIRQQKAAGIFTAVTTSVLAETEGT
jgi:hypothetical protein